jgi:Spy/CpxP family protein refolding chaperone
MAECLRCGRVTLNAARSSINSEDGAEVEEAFMRKWIVAGVALLLGGLAVGLVARAESQDRMGRGSHGEAKFSHGMFSRGRGFDKSHHMGSRILAMLENDRMKTALGLTDDQTTRLRQIVVDTEKSTIQTRADLKVRGIELRELMRADAPDQQAVMKKVDEISALRAQMMKEEMGALLNAKTVLTPEQQKKVRSFLTRRNRGEGPRFFQRRVPPLSDAPDRAPEAPTSPKQP